MREPAIFFYAHVLRERLSFAAGGIGVTIYPLDVGLSGRITLYGIWLSIGNKFITSCPSTLTQSQFDELVESVRLAGVFE